jgi:hypothetical protein
MNLFAVTCEVVLFLDMLFIVSAATGYFGILRFLFFMQGQCYF